MLIQGDARYIPLADETVQCVVTSPPYWGLRKYAGEQELIWNSELGILNSECQHQWGARLIAHQRGKVGENSTLEGGPQAGAETRIQECQQGQFCQLCGSWKGAYGLEPTVEMYVQHTVLILREIRRVLRPDGVVFWNVGDSYASIGKWGGATGGKHVDGLHGDSGVGRDKREYGSDLKSKDLCLIPARVALAAQADGWWVRSDIIWSKPNPMPESVRDRPTDAYEHILMLTKSARYYWDAEAVKESTRGSNTHSRGTKLSPPSETTDDQHLQVDGKRSHKDWSRYTSQILPSRNLRNVWHFATQPYSGAHFATFPEELPRRCIKAATSERGCCPKCGKPWEMVVKTHNPSKYAFDPDSREWANTHQKTSNAQSSKSMHRNGSGVYSTAQTLGWRPGCHCIAEHARATGLCDVPRTLDHWEKIADFLTPEFTPVPCLVLDPFGGSGTTARVAIELNRRAVSLDISLPYHSLANHRTHNVQRMLTLL